MGGVFGKVMSKLVGKKDVRILMVGLVRAAALGLAFPGVLAHPRREIRPFSHQT